MMEFVVVGMVGWLTIAAQPSSDIGPALTPNSRRTNNVTEGRQEVNIELFSVH